MNLFKEHQPKTGEIQRRQHACKIFNPQSVMCQDFPPAPASAVTLPSGRDNLMLGQKNIVS